jgi:hypothetical protein
MYFYGPSENLMLVQNCDDLTNQLHSGPRRK